jgi:hypothetical protein
VLCSIWCCCQWSALSGRRDDSTCSCLPFSTPWSLKLLLCESLWWPDGVQHLHHPASHEPFRVWLIDWLIGIGVRDLSAPMHLVLNWRALCAPNHIHESPAALPKLQMAHRPILLISSGSKKKEPKCVCLCEAQALHSHRTWAEVSSFTPHPLHVGLLAKRSRNKCLLRVLCPVRRPVTTLACVLVKDRNLALLPRLGPEINSRACLRVLPRPLQLALCWPFNQRQCLFCTSCLETPKTGSGPTKPRPEPSLASPSAISFPRTPACPRTQYSPTTCWAEMSFNALWHWFT